MPSHHSRFISLSSVAYLLIAGSSFSTSACGTPVDAVASDEAAEDMSNESLDMQSFGAPTFRQAAAPLFETLETYAFAEMEREDETCSLYLQAKSYELPTNLSRSGMGFVKAEVRCLRADQSQSRLIEVFAQNFTKPSDCYFYGRCTPFVREAESVLIGTAEDDLQLRYHDDESIEIVGGLLAEEVRSLFGGRMETADWNDFAAREATEMEFWSSREASRRSSDDVLIDPSFAGLWNELGTEVEQVQRNIEFDSLDILSFGKRLFARRLPNASPLAVGVNISCWGEKPMLSTGYRSRDCTLSIHAPVVAQSATTTAIEGNFSDVFARILFESLVDRGTDLRGFVFPQGELACRRKTDFASEDEAYECYVRAEGPTRQRMMSFRDRY